MFFFFQTNGDSNVPDYVQKLKPDCDKDSIVQEESVMQFKEALEDLHNSGETLQTVEKYGKAVEKLLLKTVAWCLQIFVWIKVLISLQFSFIVRIVL